LQLEHFNKNTKNLYNGKSLCLLMRYASVYHPWYQPYALVFSIFYDERSLKMAGVGSCLTKGCLKKCDGNKCSSTTVNSTEHTASRDENGTAVTDMSTSVTALKNDTKTGVYVGCAGRW